ncbi:MAG: CapA family protein, partial [Nitriliruptoraceae bacterium]
MGTQLELVVAGDVAVERDEGEGLFGDLTARFRDADVSFVNLEGAMSTRGTLTRGRAYFHRGGPGCAVGLREAGLSGVCLANNHMMDWGEASYEETIEVLDRNEVPWFGAGANLTEARRPLFIERDGLTIALVGATSQIPSGYAATDERCGVNPVEAHTVYSQQRSLAESPGLPPRIVTWTDPAALERIEADVSAAAEKADVVLVYVHWGTSMHHTVHDYQREIGRVVIDAGAHAVFGGHQHVVCGVEHHRGRPIIHGMGNLVFDKWEPHFTDAA